MTEESNTKKKQAESVTLTEAGNANIDIQTTTEVREVEAKVLDERQIEIYDQKRYPGINRTEFQRYWETLAADTQKYINRLASKTSWILKIDDNDTANNEEAVPKYGKHQFYYNPLSTKIWRDIEQRQAEITDLERKEAIILQNAQVEGTKAESERKVFDESEIETLRFSIAEKRANLYLLVAIKCLGMTKTQYENSIWTEIKYVLDACLFRTQHPVEVSQNLSNSSGTG